MFAKTFCKPGAFLSVVPVGLRTTLQYNANGALEKVFVGYKDDKINRSDDLLDVFKSSKLVPQVIPLKGGTTWVEGVTYTDKLFSDEGVIPMCIEKSLMEDLKHDPSVYRFYAGNVYSLASAFKSVVAIRNWLSMSRFELLPSFIVPANITNDGFFQRVYTDKYPFKLPGVSGYMIHEGTEFRYLPIYMTQAVATRVSRYNDENGYIKASIQTKGDSINVQYTDVVKFNIHTNTLLIRNSKGKLMFSLPTDTKKRDKRSNRLTCSVCGKQFLIPDKGPIQCDDIHCRSKLYPQIIHMLKVFNLPEMRYDRFTELLSTVQILCLTDIFLLDEYKESDIHVTLDKLLQAVVPVEVCSDPSVLTMFANRCSNSPTTLKYYLDNPTKLRTDLNMTSIMVNNLIKWLNDSYNVSTIDTLLESKQIHIVDKIQKFDGAPIFRGVKILITGKFLHGDMGEIISILQSYDAQVVTEFDHDVKCVVVGDLKENIDGKVIQLAKSSGLPMFEESEFFKRYEIDEDLANNLL